MSIGDTLEALARNAERLFNDAQILLEQGSHQTALALSVFAIEEVGKWHLRQLYPGQPERAVSQFRGPQAHRSKQAILGSLYYLQNEVPVLVKEIINQHRATSNAPIDSMILVGNIIAKIVDEEPSQIEKDAAAGVIDRMKQKSLYVDVNRQGAVTSTPSEIAKAEAEEWIGHARFAIRLLRISMS